MATKKEEKKEPGTDLVQWEEQMRQMAAEGAKHENAGASVISLKNGVLSYMGQPMPNDEMEVVVLGSAIEHSYYDTPYDADRIVPPTCFALSPISERTLVPHEAVPEDQKQAETCTLCWAHKFKSADNGRGRACAVRRRLVLIPASALDSEEEPDVATLKVPPTSVDAWGKYVNSLAAKYQRPIFMVTTKISVKRHPKWQFVLEFETTGLVDGDMFPDLKALAESSESALMAPFDMTPPEEEAPPAKDLKSDRRPAVTKKKVVGRR